MTLEDSYPYRLGFQQRVMARYRLDFFDMLASYCAGGLSVFAGQPRPQEAIETSTQLQVAQLVSGRNIHILSGRAYLCYQPGLMDWLTCWDPRALIVEANPRYLSTSQVVRWMHRKNRFVIGWGLGSPSHQWLFSGLQRQARKRFLHQFDVLITYSQQGAEEYLATGFPRERVFVAPNAVTHRPASSPPQRPGFFQNRPTVLFVGRLQARKRLDLLLHACAALPVELQPRLWIVGDGPARTGLEELARSIYPTSEFLGARFGAELEPYFMGADLFVLPGTGGLAVQQAMSYGLPVVVAEADGTQQDLVRPSNGWVVPPGDLAGLSSVLRVALSDVDRLRQMGITSYRIVSEEINLEVMVKVFLQSLSLSV